MEDKICGAYPAVLFSFFALASLLLLLLLLHSVRDRFLRVHDPVYISLSHRLTLFCSLNYPVVSHFLSCPSLPLLSLSLSSIGLSVPSTHRLHFSFLSVLYVLFDAFLSDIGIGSGVWRAKSRGAKAIGKNALFFWFGCVG